MFIQTEDTPNPLAMKFSPGYSFSKYENKTYGRDQDTNDAFIRSMMSIEGVDRLYFGPDFVTVTKTQDFPWIQLKPAILSVLMDFATQDFDAPSEKVSESPKDGFVDPIEAEIKEIIETRVKPAVAEHGGDIVFEKFDDGIVYLSFVGACAGCPSSEMTLKMGVERMLMHYVPEVIEVRAI